MATPINLNPTTVQPSSPPTPPVSGNVASLANPSTLSNLKNSQLPKTFGDQVKKEAVAKVKQGLVQSTLARLYEEKARLIQAGIQLDIEHQITLQKLQAQNTPKKQVQNGQTVDIPAELSDEEYQKAVEAENQNYQEAQTLIQTQKEQNQKDIDNYLKDPFKKQKDLLKKLKLSRKQKQKRNKEEKSKARKARIKSVLKNAKKSLAPILTLLLTNKIAELVAQNSKIKKLVDDTNAIIIEANESGDPTKLNNAKIARDNAIKIIQDNENKIIKIRDQINRISTYINIFTIIVTIISAIPIPTAVPPGIGIPTNLIIKLVKILDKANRILLTLSALIPILIACLEKAISILQDLRAQLLDINGQLEVASVSGVPGTEFLLNSSNEGGVGDGADTNNGIIQTEYKGFKFAIKEETGPKAIVVRGYKRRYAVAIDVNNVEVLKSDLSFTLDPNDLIEQLKIAIDRLVLRNGGTLSSSGNSNNTENADINGINNNGSLIPNNNSSSSSGGGYSSLISSLKVLTDTPPQPETIKGPTGTLSTKIPLSIPKKAFYAGLVLSPFPPTPPNVKVDAAFILKKDVEWQARYKAYQRRNQKIINNTSSPS